MESKRECYLIDVLDTRNGMPHLVRRDFVYDDCLKLYTLELDIILQEFPFRISYEDERAIDTGGVARDFFCAFWEVALVKHFDGSNLLVPSSHAQIDISVLPKLGCILAHGFMTTGFLPTKIAFPVIAATFLGPMVAIEDKILLESFIDYLCVFESNQLRQATLLAKQSVTFTKQLETALVNLLGRFGARESPTPGNIHKMVTEVARHELMMKPACSLLALHSGVPKEYLTFFSKEFSIASLFSLYKILNASPEMVLAAIREPESMTHSETRIFEYITTFVGSLGVDQIRRFLRFVTGGSAMLGKEICITFNSLQGFARRPISHTCSCTLELSTSYLTYPEFAEEFSLVLASDIYDGGVSLWAMDAV